MAVYRSKDTQNLKEVMAKMTWQERLDYLWTYYKWVLLALAFALAILCAVATMVQQKRTETLFSVSTVNVELTQEGSQWLTGEWRQLLGGTKKHQEVTVISSQFQDPTQSMDPSSEYASALSGVLMMGMQDLDCLITDERGMLHYSQQGIFPSLEQVLSPQQLSLAEGRLIYGVNTKGNTSPVAIEITGTVFAESCVICDGPVYLLFPGNTPRLERSGQFLERVLNWT